MRYWLIGVLAVCLVACGVSNATRTLNSHNEQIGEKVEQKGAQVEDPELQQLGFDAKENSKAMAKELGKPDKASTYTPAASEEERKKVPEKPWALRLLDSVWQGLVGFVVGGGAMKLAVRYLPTIFGGPLGAAFSAGLEAIGLARAQSTDGTIKLEGEGGLLDLLAKRQEVAGVREYVRAEVKKVETKLGLDV